MNGKFKCNYCDKRINKIYFALSYIYIIEYILIRCMLVFLECLHIVVVALDMRMKSMPKCQRSFPVPFVASLGTARSIC